MDDIINIAKGFAFNGRRFALSFGGIKPSNHLKYPISVSSTKGGMLMITYSELFQLMIAIIGLVSLVYKICNKK